MDVLIFQTGEECGLYEQMLSTLVSELFIDSSR
jgi:hypothetical protein